MSSNYFTEIEENWKRSVALKSMRQAMKMKGVEAGMLLGIHGPYYCRKEKAQAPVLPEEVQKMREVFVTWREGEIKRLQRLIDELNAIE